MEILRLTVFRDRTIFMTSRAMRGVSADMRSCGAGPAPAAAACNRRTGALEGTVRGHVTDPLPFLAGRGLGRAERFRPRRSFNPLPRRVPSASREARAARQDKSLRPRKCGPERKTAELERCEARLPRGRTTKARLRPAALRSLFALGVYAIRGREIECSGRMKMRARR